MKKSLRCICAAIFALAFCTGFVIHARRLSGQVPILRDILPRFSRVTAAPLK